MRSIVLLFILLSFSLIFSKGILKVNPETNRIEDEQGRERFFHGINIVIKTPPYIPEVNEFNPGNSLSEKDMTDMKEWGLNVVRLGNYFFFKDH